LLTHDHYDHIDLDSINKLIPKVKTWFVALGVSRHLEHWGVPENQITEFDWWDSIEFQGIQITFTPSRHFSGRGIADRAKSLWGGWVFKTPNHNIYWSGDGGYGPHFKEIGEKFGPFDWGFMECGQYNEHWHAIHLYPEEAVQAALDAQVKVATPVHWGGFSLALHSWKDPIERFYAEAKSQNLKMIAPEIGEVVEVNDTATPRTWWTNLT
jgi:L-ascorbate metabolism protein UlaG (beta-lactamase superfamily)